MPLRPPPATLLKMLPVALRSAREAAGLTVEEAAAATSLSTQTIENSERRGPSYPALENFFSLLDAYSISLRDFTELLREQNENELRNRLEKLEARVNTLEGTTDGK
jgi:transcriptional regulator with XRE-family HTH domain